MSSTNPPHGHRRLANSWNDIRPLANFLMLRFNRPGRFASPRQPAPTVTQPLALRWRDYTPHSLHHVVAQEIDRQFLPMVPAAWSAGGGLPAFSVACAIAGCAAFNHPGRSATQLQADVSAMPATPTPPATTLSSSNEARVRAGSQQAERDGNFPEVPLAAQIGLSEQLAAGQGVFTCYLLDALLLSSAGLLMVLKDSLDLPRPDDAVWDPRALPQMPTPMHRSFPGGHALQLALCARLLGEVMRLDAAEQTAIDAFCNAISDARRDAGVHTDHDNLGGREIGNWMADCLLAAELHPAAHPRWSALMELARAEW